MRWGMAIELKRCVGCYECVLACKAEHFLPPDIFWNRLLIGESGKYPSVTKLIYSVRCNHCADPACVMVACPYQMRSMYEDGNAQYFPGQELTEHEKAGKELYPHQPGVVQKCVFCKERIDSGIAAGLTPGVDREATPACVISCPTKAIHFGDLDDPNSEINRVIKEKHGHPFHPELDTDPSISYID